MRALLILAWFQSALAAAPPFFFATTPTAYIAETSGYRAIFLPDHITFGKTVLRFPGSASPQLSGSNPLEAKVNLLLGRDDWHTDIPAYSTLIYRNLYPGIDLTYTLGGKLKSEFIVSPGTDPSVIRMQYDDEVEVESDGSLVAGPLHEDAPRIFQGETEIPGRFVLLDPHTAAFEIGPYDTMQPLVIDPVVTYSTYLGGSGASIVTGVAVDASGNLYATGWTESLDFPIAGAAQAANQGGVDAFVVKLNAAGTAVVYATYIGGRGDDRAAGIAVDASGQAYVTGSTASSNFPVASAFDSTLSGTRNAFALKLNANGNALIYSTYLGGTNYDVGTAIAVDGSGNAYIAGDTQSANFPTQNAAQPVFGGKTDAFVTKLTPAGAISYSTYLGGSAAEHAGGIAIDSSGSAYVAGGTFSTNFPVAGAIQSANAGGQDVFVTKLGATGSTIVYSTYLGGNGGTQALPEQANGIAVDTNGNASIAGVTNSSNFPIVTGAFQSSPGGGQDAFVSKLNAAGTALVFSTYLGGFSFDWAGGIAVDSAAKIYVAGYTSSANFPISGGVQAGFSGLYDAFVSEFSGAGNALVFSTFYGGSGLDLADAIDVDTNGNIFVGGQTSSLDLPLQSPIDSANTGGSTGWLLRLGVTAAPPQLPAVVSVSPSSGSGYAATFTAQYSHSAGATSLTNVSLLINSSAALDLGCSVTYNRAANTFSLANDLASTGSTTVVPGGGSAQNSQCTLIGSGSSVSLSGTTLTMTLSLSFQPGFAGSQTVYLSASDASVNTGWVAKGSWTATVAPPQPSADSVVPNGATGASQNFTFVFSDTQNASNLSTMAMLIAPSFAFSNACYMVYDATRGSIQLAFDNGTGSSGKSISSTTVLQNSQCSLGATSVTISGLSIILTTSITFKGAFTGLQNIYMIAIDSNNTSTGWVQKGTYTVAAGGVPVANSVAPASGSGPSQRFSFTVSDQGGSGFITDVAVVIGSSTTNFNNSCVLVYDRLVGVVALSYDIAANGSGRVAPGSNTTTSNAQCTLRGPATTVVVGQTSLVVTMDIVFNASYLGQQNIYLYAAEQNANSGWINVGTWNVTGGAPTADSISPASGVGSSSTFSVTVADSVSAANISGLGLLFTTGAPTNLANSCYIVYTLPFQIALYSDDASMFGTKGLGTSTTLQNSQCAIGFTSASLTANSLILNIQVVFKPGFAGPKTIYVQSNEPASSSGWVSRGSWTVQ